MNERATPTGVHSDLMKDEQLQLSGPAGRGHAPSTEKKKKEKSKAGAASAPSAGDNMLEWRWRTAASFLEVFLQNVFWY